MAEGDTLVNALIGGVVSIVISFVPFSPIIGGAVSGYLNKRDGAKVGAYSGVVAAIPLGLLLLVILFFIPVGMMTSGAPRMGFAIGGLVLVFLFVFLVLYTIGLGALGGFIGVYLVEETA